MCFCGFILFVLFLRWTFDHSIILCLARIHNCNESKWTERVEFDNICQINNSLFLMSTNTTFCLWFSLNICSLWNCILFDQCKRWKISLRLHTNNNFKASKKKKMYWTKCNAHWRDKLHDWRDKKDNETREKRVLFNARRHFCVCQSQFESIRHPAHCGETRNDNHKSKTIHFNTHFIYSFGHFIYFILFLSLLLMFWNAFCLMRDVNKHRLPSNFKFSIFNLC